MLESDERQVRQSKGIRGVAPAISDAVYHAMRKRIRDFPFVLETFL
jgi:CO/xanthine dehydrogenase Mo-binding subunit